MSSVHQGGSTCNVPQEYQARAARWERAAVGALHTVLHTALQTAATGPQSKNTLAKLPRVPCQK